ncbi:MAG TPA: energy-coupling factor ABC transporter ATP-binding protein [Usitatibacter sp.]|nr:energy-coupling factor ABC transporter ATP-binding protein [Usitatibacter sp.]
MTPLVEVVEARKRYGDKALLDIESLTLAAGELIVLTGDNGSGKSTLLKMLAGLEPGDRLRMRFNGLEATECAYPAPMRHAVIYVHQHPYLFNTSIAENIRYGLKLRPLVPDERERRVADAIAWAGVGTLTEVEPRRLSGGEKQRVALARAKVLDPRVLLVDEPTANLDAQSRLQVMDLLRKTATGDNCVVVACHDRELIELGGAKRWHLAGGRIER